VKVLFATAELAPLATVGGLAHAASGLVAALGRLGVDVEVVLPDYRSVPLADETLTALAVPPWAGPATARRGIADGAGPVTLVSASGIERPHPYLEPTGRGWPDNDHRFFAFSAAVAALVEEREPDVVHLNDWHTAATLAFLGDDRPPAALTIHTIAYQGRSSPGWLTVFPHHRAEYTHHGDCNPMAGAIRLAEQVITVSPTYAREILTPQEGAGLEVVLAEAEPKLRGILNGIDTAVWDPATDSNLAATYTHRDPKRKRRCRKAVREELGLADSDAPLVVMVTRLVAQKGVDLALSCVPFLDRIPAQLAVLGDGDDELATRLRRVAADTYPDQVAFRRGYDEGLAHRLFAGGDLLLMPSRFEPCGLAQMQAMRYGTLPVVTDVGGLHDTVIDLDADAVRGNGVVALDVSPMGVLDALHRATRVHADRDRRDAARLRGMTADWSWDEPAAEHVALYRQLAGASPPTTATSDDPVTTSGGAAHDERA
jgi:starch synthase